MQEKQAYQQLIAAMYLYAAPELQVEIFGYLRKMGLQKEIMPEVKKIERAQGLEKVPRPASQGRARG